MHESPGNFDLAPKVSPPSRVRCSIGPRAFEVAGVDSFSETGCRLRFENDRYPVLGIGDQLALTVDVDGQPRSVCAVVSARFEDANGRALDFVFVNEGTRWGDHDQVVSTHAERRSSERFTMHGVPALLVVCQSQLAVLGDLFDVSKSGAGVVAHRTSERVLARVDTAMLSFRSHDQVQDINIEVRIINRRLITGGIQYGLKFVAGETEVRNDAVRRIRGLLDARRPRH